MEHNDMQKTINEINSTTTNSNVAENIISNDNKKESTNFIECIEEVCIYFSEYIKKVFNGFQKNNDNEKKLLQKFLKNLLRLHPLILSGISLVGMIYYFAYFGFELKYFPDLGGADVAYVGLSLFFMLAAISFFFILPCLCYPGYHEKDMGWTIFFGLSLLPLFTLVCMATLNTIINKSLDVLFLSSLIGSFLYLSIVIYIDKITTYYLYKAIAIIITIVVVLIVIIFVKFNLLFFVSIVGLYLMTLVYFKGLEYFYNNNDLLQFVVAFIIVVFAILSWFVTNEFANRLGIANVEYKYLSIEKSTLGALPKGIYDISKIAPFEKKPVFSYIDNNLTMEHDEKNNTISYTDVSHKYIQFGCEEKNCNDIKDAINIKYKDKKLSYTTKDKEDKSKENNFTIETTANLKTKDNITYTEESRDIIWLHNIKAISTLGKFYYLETKDGIRFELDASKIISREKQER